MNPESKSPKPDWLRVRLPSGEDWMRVDATLRRHGLHTVCEEARCPNKGECWGAGTATFMILGDVCTRGCKFCAVATAAKGTAVDPGEPESIAEAVRELGLAYAVLTSVDRDDLPDRGAGHFAACVNAIRAAAPGTKVETLIPDYLGSEMQAILASAPEVIAHNVETVPRLQGVRDPRAGFEKSLACLRQAAASKTCSVKTSLLLGLGETRGELLDTFATLADAGVDILVMGQYLQPTPRQVRVAEYIHPDMFNELAEEARKAGIPSVVAAPFARTSYHAHEVWRPQEGGRTDAH